MISMPSSVEHLSVVMTTETADDVNQTTAANVVTSSSSGMEFYFQCAGVVIGVVGTVANALILYGFVASKQHKKHLLIFYQNVLDLLSSLFLVIADALKLCNIYLRGLGGYWLCILVLNDSFLWTVIAASKTNLMAVTIERYLKVVHPIWSKKKLRNWMIYSAMAFALISSVIHAFGLLVPTSVVLDGVCYPYAVWISPVAQVVYTVWSFLTFYVIVLALFVFCYWRILVVIRRQARVMGGHSGPGPSNAPALSHQIQTSVIKTMILVSAFYAISELPMQMYSLLFTIRTDLTVLDMHVYSHLFTIRTDLTVLNMQVYSTVFTIRTDLTVLDGGYYASLFLSFFYICANPFIYATKFDPVKDALLRLIPCIKTPEQAIASVEIAVPGSSGKRIGQPHK